MKFTSSIQYVTESA